MVINLEKLRQDNMEEEFEKFIEYHMSICERADLMGVTVHTVDILRR